MSRGKNRDQILAAGLELFYRQGFNASGIQEITDMSGVPKGSFYNYFDSKEAFAVQVLTLYTADLSAYLDQTLIQATDSPLQRLRTLFSQWTQEFVGRNCCGCLAGNFSQELATQSPALQKALDRCFQQLQSYYHTCLEEAQAAGEINANADLQLLSSFIYNGWQGAMLRAKAQKNTQALEQFQQVVFEQLLQ